MALLQVAEMCLKQQVIEKALRQGHNWCLDESRTTSFRAHKTHVRKKKVTTTGFLSLSYDFISGSIAGWQHHRQPQAKKKEKRNGKYRNDPTTTTTN